MRFEIVLQDDDCGDCIDSALLLASAHRMSQPLLGLEAGEALVLESDLDTQCLSEFSREISRVTCHGTFRPIHVDGEPDNKALYLTATEGNSDSLQIGAEGASFDGAKRMS